MALRTFLILRRPRRRPSRKTHHAYSAFPAGSRLRRLRRHVDVADRRVGHVHLAAGVHHRRDDAGVVGDRQFADRAGGDSAADEVVGERLIGGRLAEQVAGADRAAAADARESRVAVAGGDLVVVAGDIGVGVAVADLDGAAVVALRRRVLVADGDDPAAGVAGEIDAVVAAHGLVAPVVEGGAAAGGGGGAGLRRGRRG